MRISDVRCPLVHSKGGAGCPVDIRLARTEVKRRQPYEHNGSLDFIVSSFCGSVVSRQSL